MSETLRCLITFWKLFFFIIIIFFSLHSCPNTLGVLNHFGSSFIFLSKSIGGFYFFFWMFFFIYIFSLCVSETLRCLITLISHFFCILDVFFYIISFGSSFIFLQIYRQGVVLMRVSSILDVFEIFFSYACPKNIKVLNHFGLLGGFIFFAF